MHLISSANQRLLMSRRDSAVSERAAMIRFDRVDSASGAARSACISTLPINEKGRRPKNSSAGQIGQIPHDIAVIAPGGPTWKAVAIVAEALAAAGGGR